MTLAIDASYVHEHATGVGVFAHALVKAMLRREDAAELRVFTSAPDLAARWPDRVIPVSPALTPARGVPGHLRRFLWQQAVLPRELRRIGARLLYSVAPEGILASPVPSVLTIYDLLPLRFPEIYGRMKYHFRWNLPRLLRRTRGILASSESTRREILERFPLPPEKIRVVHGAYDATRFRPRDPAAVEARVGSARYFLYVGHARPYKNLARVVEALRAIPRPEIQLWIGGAADPRFTPPLQRRIEELGMQDRVRLLGYVPDDDLPLLYSGAIGLAFASLYEGFGLPVLEAMACGCPVLASRCFSLPEVCGDAALYVDPLAIDSIAAGLERLAGEEPLRASLRERGLRRARRFSWDDAARQVLDHLQDWLGGGGAAGG